MNPPTLVEAPCGSLRGYVDNGVVSYKGIPYAAPPVGPSRWRPPQPAERWQGVLDAVAFGADFPQAANPRLRGRGHQEDCLYLNVWTPQRAAPGSLPVMVWIHGGGFTSGSGSDQRTDGARLAALGAVVVSFNYRSGMFGFFAHPALSAESAQGTSGNYGLLDQIAALRWVAANAQAFGGDPNRITVFGVSAGSASISLLLTAPQAAGLFHRAILHSPGAGRPLATLAQAQAAGAALNPDIDALRRLGARELFALNARMNPAVRGLTTARVLRPIHDGWLLPAQERAVLLRGGIRAMPLLVGTVTDEGTLLTRTWPIESLADYRNQVERNFAGAQPEAMRLYPASRDGEARAAVAQMFADTQFNLGARMLSRAMAAREPRTWRYLFTRRVAGSTDGPHHAEDAAYAFGNLETIAGADNVDRQVAASMMRAWVAFARDGRPDGAGSAGEDAAMRWPPYRADADDHLEFGDAPRNGSGWRREQLDFLERYYAEAR